MVGGGSVLREPVGKSQREEFAPCLERLCASGLAVSVECCPVFRHFTSVCVVFAVHLSGVLEC